MSSLLDTLAAQLESPREVTAQVANHLIETYGLNREGIGQFLNENLPKLEDFEIDLILSPLFTPTLRNQAAFAELLGMESVSRDEWPALIEQLVARPTCARLITEDRQEHFVPLREVTIERYVHRLRLDATIPESLFQLLCRLPPASDRPILKAVARRAIWESTTRREILVRYLTSTAGGESYLLEDVLNLTKLVEVYQLEDLADLLARIPHWQQILRQELDLAANPKPFFNERVEEMHGGGRDQRRQDHTRISPLPGKCCARWTGYSRG